MQALHQIRLPTPLQHSWTHFGATRLDLFHTLCYSIHRFSGFWPGGWLIFLFTTVPQPSFLMFYIVSLAMTFAFLLTRVQILLWLDNFWVFWVKMFQILPGPQDLCDFLKSVVPARLTAVQLGQSKCKRERGRNMIKRKGAKGSRMNKLIPSMNPWHCILVDADIKWNTNHLPPSVFRLYS